MTAPVWGLPDEPLDWPLPDEPLDWPLPDEPPDWFGALPPPNQPQPLENAPKCKKRTSNRKNHGSAQKAPKP